MRPTFIIAAAGVAALLTIASPAWAQANRTFVSGHGSDSNPCSLSDPCRSFAGALAQTNAGGEITVLDSAGYGTLTIGKSVTITNPGGVEAGITTTTGQTAITINPSSSIVVTLRGLTLQGGGVGANGINYAPTVPGTLNIIDCVVKDFAGIGIVITPTFSGFSPTESMLIANSFVLNNGGSGIEILLQNATTDFTYLIDHTTIAGNGTSGSDTGIFVNSGSGGLLSGEINSVKVYHNFLGVIFTGTGNSGSATTIRNSVIIGSDHSDLSDTDSGVNLSLLNSNQIGFLQNNEIIMFDNTNNIHNSTGPGTFTSVGRQ